MKPFRFDLSSLSVQLILSLVAVVLLTAAAAGLPAIWLIRNQLERQAWAQVDQAAQAAQALYSAEESEMDNLATLTAQRPTLHNLLTQGAPDSLLTYLSTLQVSAGLDLLLVCDVGHRKLAQVGEMLDAPLCTAEMPAVFYRLSNGGGPQLWLMGAQPIRGDSAGAQGTVIVGIRLDERFAAQMRAQTGLEHTLLVDGKPVATSLSVGLSYPQPASSEVGDGSARAVFSLNGHPYYAASFPLVSPSFSEDGRSSDLRVEVALPVADIAATQRKLAWALAGSIVLVASVGSMLGIFLARRIGSPLTRLAEVATAFSKGNLATSVPRQTRVREIALVADALEKAGIDLQRGMTELREEKAWTGHLLEAIVEGIVTLDHRGKITFFSQGAERITGWARDDVLGRSCDEVFRPVESPESFSQFIPPPGQRRKITLELANARQAILAVTGARLTPPVTGDARVALVFRDVSEEEAVHRLMGHFLANVAHEFRTPLSALAASVELLLDQFPHLSPTELKDLLTSLHLGILGLQTLVDNLLESASIEAGRFRVSPRRTNLGQIIAEAIRLMQPLLDKRGQRLVVELPAELPLVRADTRRVVQVLVNMLSNASKYGPDDAEIIVSACAGKDEARVSVSDRGPGIPPEHRSDLFRRFVYLHKDSDGAQYGVGLGLSVVKAIVEAHSGQVGVEDRPGGGSIFWFTLPVEGEQ